MAAEVDEARAAACPRSGPPGHARKVKQSGAGPMKGTIFLSYPSSLEEMAARIELSLKGEGYAVFRDRSALPPGESFDARIRAAVEESDLFVFLITPESVSPGRYTLTELKLVEQRWGHPAGRVLPVLAEATPMEAIPAFLRAVTILKPHGNLVAEVAAEVARLSAPWWRRMLSRGGWCRPSSSRFSSPAARGWGCPPISSAASRTPRRPRSWTGAGRRSRPGTTRTRGNCWSRPTPWRPPRARCSRRRSSWP